MGHVSRWLFVILTLLLWSWAVDAQERTSGASVRLYAETLCLGMLEEMSGVPPWQLQYLGGGAELVRACHEAPYPTMSKLKGVGNLFVPAEQLRRAGRAVPQQ